jgi:hypothetical protein
MNHSFFADTCRDSVHQMVRALDGKFLGMKLFIISFACGTIKLLKFDIGENTNKKPSKTRSANKMFIDYNL